MEKITVKHLDNTDSILLIKKDDGTELVNFCENGNIFIKNRLIETDKEITSILKDFLGGLKLK